MSAPAGGKDGQAARPLGPDGKPIPGPAEVRQIQAARKMAQQQAQVRRAVATKAPLRVQFLLTFFGGGGGKSKKLRLY